MIVWTGEGTLLDAAGPHHTLTILGKNTYITEQIQKHKHGWSYWSQRHGTMVQAFGGFHLSIKLTRTLLRS